MLKYVKRAKVPSAICSRIEGDQCLCVQFLAIQPICCFFGTPFFLFYVWVCLRKIAHHTCGFGFVLFFGFGCFWIGVWVWGEGLFHTVNMDVMLGCVSVSVVECCRLYFL